MKNKVFLTWVLGLVSVFMLAMPLVPHHHHESGTACVKDDAGREMEHSGRHGHRLPCYPIGCTARAMVTPPTGYSQAILHPRSYDLLPSLAGLRIPLSALSPAEGQEEASGIYIEAIHSILFVPSFGLRAPPTHV